VGKFSLKFGSVVRFIVLIIKVIVDSETAEGRNSFDLLGNVAKTVHRCSKTVMNQRGDLLVQDTRTRTRTPLIWRWPAEKRVPIDISKDSVEVKKECEWD